MSEIENRNKIETKRENPLPGLTWATCWPDYVPAQPTGQRQSSLSSRQEDRGVCSPHAATCPATSGLPAPFRGSLEAPRTPRAPLTPPRVDPLLCSLSLALSRDSRSAAVAAAHRRRAPCRPSFVSTSSAPSPATSLSSHVMWEALERRHHRLPHRPPPENAVVALSSPEPPRAH